MTATLTVVGGVQGGRDIPIHGPEFIIGRDPKCHLRPTSNDVSRQHCAFVFHEEMVLLRDYGSRNGTLVNGRLLLNGALQLSDGDTIQVGPLVFRMNLAAQTQGVVAGMPTRQPAEQDAGSPDDVINTEPGAGEPSADDTVLIPKASVPPVKQATKQQKDSEALLCWE
jgi:pSer/pThr/pTyr-binding forkhead associated (FHA) protein